jgi:hypothetical protein
MTTTHSSDPVPILAFRRPGASLSAPLGSMVAVMRPAVRIALDLVLVLVFSVIGRASHRETLSPGGILTTAWPFLVAALLASLLACVVLRLSWLREGLLVWFLTVVVGMLLRGVAGGGLAIGFLIVATLVLAAFLIGWRLVWSLVTRHSATVGTAT